MKPVESLLIVKMLREIWIVRCYLVFDNHTSQSENDIIYQFKTKPKYFLFLEKGRLNDLVFRQLYTH